MNTIIIYIICFLIGYNLYLFFHLFNNLSIGAPDNLNELNTKLEKAFNSDNNGIYISTFVRALGKRDSIGIDDIQTMTVDTSATLLNKDIVNGAFGIPASAIPLPVGFFWDPDISQNASFAICGFEIDASTDGRYKILDGNYGYVRGTHDKCGLLDMYTSKKKDGNIDYETMCSTYDENRNRGTINTPCTDYIQKGNNPSWKLNTDNRPPRFISKTKDNYLLYNEKSWKNPTEITSSMISLLKNNKSDIESVRSTKIDGTGKENTFNYNEIVFYNSEIQYSNKQISLENMLSEFSSNNILPAGYIQLIDDTDKQRWSLNWTRNDQLEQIESIMKNAVKKSKLNDYLYIIKIGEDDNGNSIIKEKKLVKLDKLNLMDNVYSFINKADRWINKYILKHGEIIGIIAGVCCLCCCINCAYPENEIPPYRRGAQFILRGAQLILSKITTTQDNSIPLLPLSEQDQIGGSERRRRLLNNNCVPHIEEIKLNWPLILSKMNLVLPLSIINECLYTISLRLKNLIKELNTISTSTNNCNVRSNVCMSGGYNNFSKSSYENKLKRYMFNVTDSFEDCITIYYNGTILTNNSFKIIVCFAKRADIPLQFIENLKTKQNKNELLVSLCEYYHIFINDEINKTVFKQYDQCN